MQTTAWRSLHRIALTALLIALVVRPSWLDAAPFAPAGGPVIYERASLLSSQPPWAGCAGLYRGDGRCGNAGDLVVTLTRQTTFLPLSRTITHYRARLFPSRRSGAGACAWHGSGPTFSLGSVWPAAGIFENASLA
jgi:osmoprotectant transport system permease protein